MSCLFLMVCFHHGLRNGFGMICFSVCPVGWRWRLVVGCQVGEHLDSPWHSRSANKSAHFKARRQAARNTAWKVIIISCNYRPEKVPLFKTAIQSARPCSCPFRTTGTMSNLCHEWIFWSNFRRWETAPFVRRHIVTCSCFFYVDPT